MKQRILEAAVAEIELYGSSFRMDDLAKRLNISKRTLYENFHSKNEIIERILFEKSQDFYNLHKEILEDPTLDCVTKLKKYFSVRSDLYAAISGDHYRLMFASVPSLVDHVLRVFERDWELLGSFLEEQQRMGIIKPGNIEVLLLMLKGVVRTVFYDEHRNPEDCITILSEAMNMILHGILNEEAKNE
ncbi:TetR/AcrR family transcriptional regulator [Veillonella intestinalis]|uniref:TetR/AcrR family transcriptional regulator n=1 Tax=Veillonella intestinalis TaxID=2941341 RepID=UPI00203FDE58|nr:TetR/AcrR family transcriptional regulator [Veillonella intestinalis]